MSSEQTILTLLESAYFGTGGFEFAAQDGVVANTKASESYLVKHPREHHEDFAARCKVAYYLNYMAPCVDAHVSPLFRREATREVQGSGAALAQWEAFAADADGAETSLADVMRAAATPAKRDGSVYLVVTAPEEAPRSVAEAVLPGRHPYVYQVAALDVVSLVRDRFGRIVSFTHLESEPGETEARRRTLTQYGWQLTNANGEPLKSGEFATPFTTAPVVEIRTGQMVRGWMLPRSQFVGIARASHRLFNLCSELDELFRGQAFAVLIYPSRDLAGLTIGVNNALGFDPEGKHAPAFIAPPDGPAKLLMEHIDRLVREIYRQALLTHQTGTTGAQQVQTIMSGVALRIDREALDTALGDFAGELEKAERQIAALWSWYTGEALEYQVGYPRDFVLQDEATLLAPLFEAWTTLLAEMPPALKAGLMERIGGILLEDDPTRLEELIDYLNAKAAEDTASQVQDAQDQQGQAQQDQNGQTVQDQQGNASA